MLPFLTFASGIIAGVVGVKLLKNVKAPESLETLGDKARSGLDKAGAGLRDATLSGLTAIEKSTASLRGKLAAVGEAEAEAEAAPPAAPAAVNVAKKATPRRKVAAKKKAAAPAPAAPAPAPAAAPAPVEPKPEEES